MCYILVLSSPWFFAMIRGTRNKIIQGSFLSKLGSTYLCLGSCLTNQNKAYFICTFLRNLWQQFLAKPKNIFLLTGICSLIYFTGVAPFNICFSWVLLLKRRFKFISFYFINKGCKTPKAVGKFNILVTIKKVNPFGGLV